MNFFKKVFGGTKVGEKQDPPNVEERMQKAMKHQVEKEFEAAIQEYSNAIEMQPSHCPAYFGRGTCYLSLDMCDLAIEDATKHIELDPNAFEGFFLRGLCLHRLKRPALAVPDLCRALELNPEDQELLSRRGHIFRDLNCFDRALDDFRKASTLGGDRRPVSEWDVALCWDTLDCPRNAMQAYQAFLDNNPQAPQHARKTAQERSITNLTKVLNDKSLTSADEHAARAVTLSEAENYAEAISELARAIVKEESPVQLYLSYLQRGEIFYKLEMDVLALMDFSSAIQIDPQKTEAYADRGDLHYETGQHQLAETDYLKALSLYPKQEEFLSHESGKEGFHKQIYEVHPAAASVHDSLGILYLNTGRVRQAVEHFEMAVNGAPMNSKYQQHLNKAREVTTRDISH